MDWRLANSLITLRTQVNAMWPNRSKASDGTIGDAAHQAQHSEHNPNAAGVVTAMDITQDPANGADMQVLADMLIASKDSRTWYIIFNRRIWQADTGWQPYSGTADPHTNHLHISVAQDAAHYDNAAKWSIKGVAMEDNPTQKQVYDHFKAYDVKGEHPSGEPTQQQLDYYAAHPWSVLYLALLDYNHDRRREAEKQVAVLSAKETKLGPGKYIV